MDADRLAEIKARHVRVPYEFPDPDQCPWCTEDWPCDVAPLVAEVERLTAQHAFDQKIIAGYADRVAELERLQAEDVINHLIAPRSDIIPVVEPIQT